MKSTASKRLPSFRNYVPPGTAAAKSPRGSNTKRNARGRNLRHELIVKSLLNPTAGVCSCGRFNLSTQLAQGTSEHAAQLYLDKWHGEHTKLEKREATRKALQDNPKKNPQSKFSQDTIKKLRTRFAAIDGANIAKARAEFDKIFAGTSRPLLKQLASAKIEWVSQLAENALVARRNPATKKNMHPLEIASNSAIVLGGLDHLWSLLNRTKKVTKRKKKNGASVTPPAAKKTNGAIRMSAADIAKLSPAVRARLGVEEQGGKPKSEPKERLWRVTWYSPKLQRRVGPSSLFEADHKSGAIAEAKVAIGYDHLKRRKLPLPVNFKAREVKSNPKAIENIGLISLVENLQAAEWLGGKLGSKKKHAQHKNPFSKEFADRAVAAMKRPCEKCGKRNSTHFGYNRKFVCTPCFKKQKPPTRAKKNPGETERAKIRREFLGREPKGGEKRYFTLPGSPARVADLAPLASIELMNGKVQNFKKGSAVIGGVKQGKLRRMVIGIEQLFPIPNGLDADKAVVMDEVKRFDYWAMKPHLFADNDPDKYKVHRWTHKAGEEGGRRPVLVFHNGAIGFRGGDYKIQAEGVRD